MINQFLHRQPAALDSDKHRNLKLRLPITDWSVAKDLNAMFVAAAEFSDVCREFPIVFVKAGKEPDGSEAIAPIAVFGLTQNENLYVSGTRWRANYMPAVLRSYPFCIARLDDERFAVCFDSAWPGTSVLEGAPLFAEDGKPAELLTEITKHMENMEGEIQRTRLVGKKLQELGLLQEMRFDATLPDGKQHIMLSSGDGMVIRFAEEEVRAMGRNARGVRGMGLRDDDRVVAMSTLPAELDAELQVLTICAKGYGKRTPAGEYRAQSRAGLGLITIKVNERNGEVVENLLVHPDDHIIVITSQGKVIRTTVDGISVLGRNTQGVRIIRMGEGERVVAAARMLDDGDKREDEAGVVARAGEVSTEHGQAPEPDDGEPEGDDSE